METGWERPSRADAYTVQRATVEPSQLGQHLQIQFPHTCISQRAERQSRSAHYLLPSCLGGSVTGGLSLSQSFMATIPSLHVWRTFTVDAPFTGWADESQAGGRLPACALLSVRIIVEGRTHDFPGRQTPWKPALTTLVSKAWVKTLQSRQADTAKARVFSRDSHLAHTSGVKTSCLPRCHGALKTPPSSTGHPSCGICTMRFEASHLH